MKTAKFKVPKMKCNGCVNTIRNGLLDIHGIESVETDLGTQVVTISYNDAPFFETLIAAKLKAIGYEGELLEQAL